MVDYTFEQLVNLEQVRRIMESHHRLSGMPYGLFDSDDNLVVAIGWQEICTNFHRADPVACARCRESDVFVKAHLLDCKDDFLEYRCKNGMIDIALPILIVGKHKATFFTGQFFYDDDLPDRNYFIAQAEAYGFDQNRYLKALESVPVFSRKHIRDNVLFLHNMVQVMAEMGHANLRVAHEVQERISVEKEKLEQEQQYKRIIDIANDGVFILDIDLRISFINPQMARRLGYAVQEMQGHVIEEFVSEADLPIYRQRMENRHNGISDHYEIRLRHRDGHDVWSYVSGSPILDEKGYFLGAFAMHKDITRRKQAEEALKSREQEFHTLVENIPDFIVRYDHRLCHIYVNPAWEKASGLAANEVVNVPIGNTPNVPCAVPDEYLKCLNDVLENGTTKTAEFAWRNSRGEILPVEYVLTPEFDGTGKIAGILAVGHDLTERKRAEATHNRLNRELRAITECNQVLVRATDEQQLLNDICRIVCEKAG